MKRSFSNRLFNDPRGLWLILAVYILAAITISVIQYYSGLKAVWGGQYTHYNNYVIFKTSFTHLVENANLYQLYPAEYADHFKYSPSFALVMGPFTLLPDLPGLMIWNMLNVFVFFIAIKDIPAISNRSKALVLLFVLPELIASVQNSQSNALLAGLIILCFSRLEKRDVISASIVIMLSLYIKIFGIVALLLYMFYRNKFLAAMYLLAAGALLGSLPLAVVSPVDLYEQYMNWFELLSKDHSGSYGISVMGWLHSWFGLDSGKELVVLLGALLLCIPLVRQKMYSSYRFRLLLLSSALVWIVIFNHKAESPTYIIAVTGIALWFFMRERTGFDLALLIFVFILTMLSSTDLFPRYLRSEFIAPYVLKALPCIIVWFRMLYEMLSMKSETVMAAEPIPQ